MKLKDWNRKITTGKYPFGKDYQFGRLTEQKQPGSYHFQLHHS